MSKKIGILYILLVCNIFVFAQDDSYYESFFLPDPPQGMISPEVHTDNRVTFRLYAPNAFDVKLQAECLGSDEDTTPFGTSRGTVVMKKDSTGIWSFTTNYPIYPNCYTYNYLVNLVENVVDPLNPDDAWNQGSHFSVFAVGGDSIADLLTNNNVPHGKIEQLEYFEIDLHKEVY